MKGRWLETPWVVVNCDSGEVHNFTNRKLAAQWVIDQQISKDEPILYPHSPYRILSAQEVRAMEAIGGCIGDDCGESSDWH